ncbi:MFS transporter [Actinoplanes couchii]|uniref:MFS transporter n=1 Tax=Actinoplanes couchii TaxID=403638 RepID=A0ABQ3X6R9_9ACTN|nr:MFS transporter [Actinoplanes couchii]MDR6322038.1 MFS family permease [Actinoplanes couchii]GID54202.1 MFS transporter [Actinoplanes couchii]
MTEAPRSLWRNRDFLLLWTGQALSAFGSSLAAVAYPLLALAATGSVSQAGLVGFVGLAANALMLLPAGLLTDRLPRKALLVVGDLVRALAAAAVVVGVAYDRVGLPLLLITTAISSLAGAVSGAAQTVVVRHVVPAEQLPAAFAQNEARSHVATLTGQPAGGHLYGLWPGLPVLADAVSYLLGALLTLLIRTPLHDDGPPPERAPLRRDLTAGLRYLWHHPTLRSILFCATALQVLFVSLPLIIVAAGADTGVVASGIGLAFAIGGVGGILGAWATGRMRRMLSGFALIAIFGWTTTVAFAVLGWTSRPLAVGAMLAVMYFTATPANALIMTLLLDRTAPEMQGRVVSSAMLVATCATPVGPVIVGLLYDAYGRLVTFLVFAALTAAITIAMYLSGALRSLGKQTVS